MAQVIGACNLIEKRHVSWKVLGRNMESRFKFGLPKRATIGTDSCLVGHVRCISAESKINDTTPKQGDALAAILHTPRYCRLPTELCLPNYSILYNNFDSNCQRIMPHNKQWFMPLLSISLGSVVAWYVARRRQNLRPLSLCNPFLASIRRNQ